MTGTKRSLKRRYAPLPLCAAGCALIALSAEQILPTRLIWNASPSVPTGLYSVSDRSPKHGDLVLVALPEDPQQLANRRGYLPANVPALKRIVALSGDTVCRFGRVVFVNGNRVATAKLTDARALKMSRWRGCVYLSSRQVFLLADHRDSFDGRYFGVTDIAGIHGVAMPLWIDPQ